MKHEGIIARGVRPAHWYWLWAVTPLVILLAMWPNKIALDDAYITLHNARVLLSGEPDPVYGSSYMAGATSLVHLLLVAAVSSVADPVRGSIAISLYGALLYIFGLTKIADRAGLSGWLKAAVVVLGAAAGRSSWFYTNGLETSLGMAVAAWMLVWCDDRRKLPALAGIAPFIRPELGLLSALLLLRLGRQLPLRQKAEATAIAIAFAAPWALWSMYEVGRVIPSTVGAKLAFYRQSELSAPIRVLTFVYAHLGSNQIPLFLGLAGLLRVPAGKSAAAFVLIGSAVALAIMPDMANWNGGRYTAIFLPILIAGIAGIAAERTRLSYLVIAALLAWSVITAIPGAHLYGRMKEPLEDYTQVVARLPASATVLIHDAGEVAWVAPKAKLVDMVGLKTPEVAEIHRRLTPAACQRGKALDYIARQYRVTHMAVLKLGPWPCNVDNLRSEGWKANPVFRGRIFWVYELTPPAGP